MRELVRSWGESLGYLKPSSLKQWGLVTLKGSLASYKVLLKYCWWLLFAIFITSYYEVLFKREIYNLIISTVAVRPGPNGEISRVNEKSSASFSSQMASYEARANVAMWVYFVLLMIWWACCFLTVRPSITKKDIRYFAGNWIHGLASLLLIILMVIVLVSILVGWWYIDCVPNMEVDSFILMHLANGYTAQFLVALISLLTVFAVFFLLDFLCPFRYIFKSIGNGMKLVWYQLPLCLVLSTALYLLQFGIGFIKWRTTLMFIDYELIVFCLLFPVYLHILIYIYITQVHSHPEKY